MKTINRLAATIQAITIQFMRTPSIHVSASHRVYCRRMTAAPARGQLALAMVGQEARISPSPSTVRKKLCAIANETTSGLTRTLTQ